MNACGRFLLAGVAVMASAAVGAGQTAPGNFFASRVIEYSPGVGNELFPDPQLALGGPRGLGWLSGSLHVVTLGVQGRLVLGFRPGEALTDGAGPDLIVAENPFGVSTRFAELVRVGVSTNGVDFAFFPTWCGLTEQVPPYGRIDPSQVGGFAGVEPVFANTGPPPPEGQGNDVDPFDPEATGGDLFDLAELADHDLVVQGKVDLGRIYYVKLVDVLGDGSEQDSLGSPVYDPTGNMDPPYGDETSADIDALSVVNGLPAPAPGDVNRDGLVNGRDYTIWADHYGLAAATWEDGDLNADAVVTGSDYSIWADNYGYLGGGAGRPEVPLPGTLALWVFGAYPLLRFRMRSLRLGRAGPAGRTRRPC